MSRTWLLLAIVFISVLFFPLVEQAASSPATLIQLATSSPELNGWVRPVRQRGMYFGAPSWER